MIKKIVLVIVLLAMIGGLTYGAETESPREELSEKQEGGITDVRSNNGFEPISEKSKGTVTGIEESSGYLEVKEGGSRGTSSNIDKTKKGVSRAKQSTNIRNDRTSSTVYYTATFKITAYTAGAESTGKSPGHPAYGITASGVKVRENHTIAADWTILPPGTTLKIEGLPHIYTVEDRGSAIKGNRLDIYIADLEAALKWGVQERKVIILEMGGK